MMEPGSWNNPVTKASKLKLWLELQGRTLAASEFLFPLPLGFSVRMDREGQVRNREQSCPHA